MILQKIRVNMELIMARFTSLEVYQAMFESGLGASVLQPRAEVSKKVAQAVSAGGARVLEFTNRGDFAFDVFKQLSKSLAAEEFAADVGCWFGCRCTYGSHVYQGGCQFCRWTDFQPRSSPICATGERLPICRAAARSMKFPKLKNMALRS